MDLSNLDKISLNFIIGIGRSGTTILSKLLNKYVDVQCLPEANFFVFFLQKYKNKKHFTSQEINVIFEEIDIYSLSHPLLGWKFESLEAKKNIEKLLNSSKNISYNKLCILIFTHFKVDGLNKEKATLLLDKNPSYTIFVNEIAQALPNSKFVYIVRDYRANILSRKQSIYLKSPNIAYNATRWKLYNQIAYNFYKKNTDKVLIVKYENLVSEPEQEMQKIVNFLNIKSEQETNDYDNTVTLNLNDYQIAERFRERFIKKYSDLNKSINKDRLDVWKEKLSSEEIKLADTICSESSRVFGYTSSNNINMLNSVALKLKHSVPIIKGYIDIYKDKLIYYLPIRYKMKRLIIRYKQLNFIPK